MTSHPSTIISLYESFMKHWKVAGKLVRPKNMMVGSKRSLWVMKAGSHWCLSLIWILSYLHCTSNLVKTLASHSLSMRSEIRRRGKPEGSWRGKFARLEVLIEEVFGSFLLTRREGVDFPNLRHEGFIKVYFMIIRLGWRYVVSGFFKEDKGEFSVFRG